MRRLFSFLMVGVIATLSFAAEPKPFSKALLEVWDKQKCFPVWSGNSYDEGLINYQQFKGTLETEDLLPALNVPSKLKPGDLKNLPAPDQPFGLCFFFVDNENKHLLEEAKTFKNLKRVAVHNGNVDEKEIIILADLTDLEELQLFGTKISDTGLKALTKIKNLKRLGLNNTKITDEGIATLKAFDNLERLDIGYNPQLTDKCLPALVEMKSLKYLDLHYTKITDEGLKTLAKMDFLTGLHLVSTKTTATGLKHLATLKNLERLQVDGQTVDKDSFPVVLGLKKLKYLGMNVSDSEYVSLGDADFKKLEVLTDLQRLAVYQWKITEESLPTIKGFKKLEYVELGRTQIKPASLDQLRKDFPKWRIYPPG